MTTKRIMWLAAIIYIGIAVCGCLTEVDPNGVKTVRLDADKVEQFEKGAEAGVSIMQALAPFWPPAAGLAVGLAAALAAWRKQKGKLIIQQSETEMYHSAAASLVAAIGDYRNANPQQWAKLKIRLKKAIGPEAENVIRALRGLPEKK